MQQSGIGGILSSLRKHVTTLLATLVVISLGTAIWCYLRKNSKELNYGLNLVLPALGGKLESETSNNTALRELVFSFYQQREALINAVVINPSSEEILADLTRMPKDVSISVSSSSSTEGFTRVATATLTQAIGEQSISFAPTRAKYVKVRFLSTYGGSFADVREVKISEASPAEASVIAGQPLDLVASDLGGEIESITNEYGPGYNGRLLIDGRSDTVWQANANSFPQEIVLSFFNRQSALISSVEIVPSTNAAASPKDVEVWTSMESPTNGFTQLAVAELKPGLSQTISFSPVEARFLKLRVLSSHQSGPLEIGEIRVPEAQAPGYTSLARRNREMLSWKRSPTRAAQLGIEWLQPAAMDWQNRNQCFGCHSQAQVIMGLSVARKNKYIVNDECLKNLVTFVQNKQTDSHVTAGQFAAMALANFEDLAGSPDPALLKLATWLVGQQQSSGEIAIDHIEPPIDQGNLMTTTNSVVAFMQSFWRTGDAHFKEAADRGLAWITSAEPETTQDKAFKIMALSWFGSQAQHSIVQNLVEQLKQQQNKDGGWQEARGTKGSNAFATGQVLYAFKQARVSIDSPEFIRGVEFLLATQKNTGAWPSFNSQSSRPSDYAPTMWAVIGLAGSFRERTGSLGVVSNAEQSKKKIGKNIEIILDLSGSMNLPLGKSTRIATAHDVLESVLRKLPPDFNVGLRLYGHRFPSLSKQTCTDTELVLPIQQLDIPQLLAAVARYKPRGDTPLVYSVLQTPADLKQVGGGSVILITDGEETCHGDPIAASRQLKESGIAVTLDIVGFTVKGKEIEDQLRSFAESTGGHYYTAEDGDALARSLQAAAIRFPYKVFDQAGRLITAGQADGPAQDLPPGDYKVIVYSRGQEIAMKQVTVGPGKDIVFRLITLGDRFSLEQ